MSASILDPLCRGIVGYISYLAACRNSEIYSEYLLYEPIIRIAHAQGYRAKCEVSLPKSEAGKGDNKRIDFLLEKDDASLCLEIKWARNKRINITNDVNKLLHCNDLYGTRGYILMFGKSAVLSKITASDNRSYISKGRLVSWDAGRTDYSARWWRYI